MNDEQTRQDVQRVQEALNVLHDAINKVWGLRDILSVNNISGALALAQSHLNTEIRNTEWLEEVTVVELDTMWRMFYKGECYSANGIGELTDILQRN